MVKPNLQPATLEHAEYIAERVRDADRDELWASNLMTPIKVMTAGIKYAKHVTTGLDDDEPVVMWGVYRPCLLTSYGIPWMVGTHKLDEKDVSVAFLKRCREPLVAFFKEFDILENYVDARNVRAIRWLRFMGFTVEEEAEPYGELKLPFHRFWMKG